MSDAVNQHIMVVEDEPKIAELIGKYLKLEGYDFSLVSNGKQAIVEFQKYAPDLMVLDIMMPGMDGLEVCKRLREFSDVPIIMLTARIEEIDRLIGFDFGADDYLCKPFNPRELIARIKAILCRGRVRQSADTEIIKVGNMILNVSQHTLIVNNSKIRLTLNEFNLLKVLISHPNKVFSRRELLSATQREYFESYERTIDSHIKNVRKKINEIDPQTDYIESIYGVGYKFLD